MESDVAHPTSVTCEICHKEFSTATINFHLKFCIKEKLSLRKGSYKNLPLKCQFCGEVISSVNYVNHISRCKAKLINAKSADRLDLECLTDRTNATTQATNHFTTHALDNRVECPFCNRKFMTERIDRHKAIWENLWKRKSVGRKLPRIELDKIQRKSITPIKSEDTKWAK